MKKFVIAAAVLAVGLVFVGPVLADSPPPVKPVTLFESGPVTLGSTTTVVTLQPVAQPVQTYHWETRCDGTRCIRVQVPDQPAIVTQPVTGPTCNCASCPAGGNCTAGQCGVSGCGSTASGGFQVVRFPAAHAVGYRVTHPFGGFFRRR